MYYTHPGCRTSIFGENRAYCIRNFTVIGYIYLNFYEDDFIFVTSHVHRIQSVSAVFCPFFLVKR